MANSFDITAITGNSSSSATSIVSLQQQIAKLRTSSQLSQVDIEARTRLRLERTQVKQRSSALSTLNSELSTLKRLAKELNVERLIQKSPARKVDAAPASVLSSNAGAVGATINGSPTAGTFSINVLQTATASSLAGKAIPTSISKTVTTPASEVVTYGAAVAMTDFSSSNDKVELNGDFADGDEIKFSSSFGGLSANQTYFVSRSGNDYRLYTTKEAALNGSDSSRIDLTSSSSTIGVTASKVTRTYIPESTTTVQTPVNLNLNSALSSSGMPDLSLNNGAGQIRINGTDISFNSSQSINDVLNAINESGAGVTASFNATTRQFSLVNKSTGSSAISVSDMQGNFASALGLTTGTQSVGKNALFTVNGGQQLSSSTNTVSGSLFNANGLTVDLKQATTGPINVTVTPATTGSTTIQTVDPNTVKTEIKAFFEQYNKVQSYLETATAEGGALFGERSILGLSSNLRQGLRSIFGSTQLTSGVSSNGSTNSLSINDDALKSGIAGNTDAVLDLLRTADGRGFAANTISLLSPLTGSGGTLANRVSSLDRDSTRIEDQLTQLSKREDENRQKLLDSFSQIAKSMVIAQNNSTFLSRLGTSGTSNSSFGLS